MIDNYSTINNWIADLYHTEVERRWIAAGELAQCGNPALQPLLVCYSTADWTVKHIVLWALGEFRSEALLELFIAALSEPQLHVQLSAIRALEKLADSGSSTAKSALEQWKTQSNPRNS